jgi:DNA helicase II / ATP-dependent DNA helicase PcrA
MNIERLKGIKISDDDIDWVETIMGSSLHFDDNRRTIIKNMESTDIQAFPGTGKTTALVAKLAILANKWTLTNSGICVLSHTNVAREEIINRLGNTEVGKKLLSYPHFIGTLHSFFDIFISLPWLRSKGIKINLIDSHIVRKVRWYDLPFNTRSYLIQQYKDESICEYKGSIGSIDWDKHGETGSLIRLVIKQSQDLGNFTFDEMLLYAQEALTQCDSFQTAIQNRFPLLLIDEAQDTNAFQWNLLHHAFSSDGSLSIRQSFGDSNQAIYNNVNETVNNPEFPRENPLLLCESRRFDGRIAMLTNTVSISSAKMIGTENEFSDRACCHTIYLFAKEKATQAIDEFANLVLETFSDEELTSNKKIGCHVIGMVHDKKGEETPEGQFPKGIYDYWPAYEAKKSYKNVTPESLVEYFRLGKSEFASKNETACQVEWIVKGLRCLINKAKGKNYIAVSNNTLFSLVRMLPEESQMNFRKLIADFLLADISTEERWDLLADHFKTVLGFFDTVSNVTVNRFLRWTDDAICDSGCFDSNIIQPNCYVYKNTRTGRSVNLEFGSIHSVKGRTHLATLILETFTRAHNMKSIIKYLCNMPHKSLANNQNLNRLKCQYVAMSRAKGLLCLAIPKEFVDEKAQVKLKDIGWHLKVIE